MFSLRLQSYVGCLQCIYFLSLGMAMTTAKLLTGTEGRVDLIRMPPRVAPTGGNSSSDFLVLVWTQCLEQLHGLIVAENLLNQCYISLKMLLHRQTVKYHMHFWQWRTNRCHRGTSSLHKFTVDTRNTLKLVCLNLCVSLGKL